MNGWRYVDKRDHDDPHPGSKWWSEKSKKTGPIAAAYNGGKAWQELGDKDFYIRTGGPRIIHANGKKIFKFNTIRPL